MNKLTSDEKKFLLTTCKSLNNSLKPMQEIGIKNYQIDIITSNIENPDWAFGKCVCLLPFALNSLVGEWINKNIDNILDFNKALEANQNIANYKISKVRDIIVKYKYHKLGEFPPR